LPTLPSRELEYQILDDTVVAYRSETGLEMTVRATVENRDRVPVYLRMCGHTLQQLRQGSWSEVWVVECSPV
jgi:hypothetical protein